MVLSNKKLKQKLRSLVAESLAVAEARDPPGDATAGGGGEELQNLKELLGAKSQKPSFSNKVKKRKKAAISEDSKPTDEAEASCKENGDEEEEEERKKRKTEDDSEGITKAKKSKKKKDGKKKKKKTWREIKEERKKKKQERDERDAEKNKIVTGVSYETGVVVEPIDVELREQNAKKVYVGGIPYYSTEDDIRSFFESCGTVTEVDCMTFPESGKFRGIAMLTFKTEAAAKRALALDGSDMGGFYLKIQPYRGSRTNKSDFAPDIVEGYNRAYVGNLSWDITEDDLQKLFSNCNISSIRFGMDKDTGDFKGFAHVDFSDSASLKNALKFDQEVVCGRPVRIRCAVPKKSGSNSSSTNAAVKVEDGTGTGNSKKQKRRTCYECGVPGHLSSACPKKAAEAVGSGGNSC